MAASRIQTDEIKRCVGIVVARLKMKLEEPLPSKDSVRILLVEGSTDKLFYEKKKNNDVSCFSMGDILKARSIIKDSTEKNVSNCKEAIMHTVYGLNVLPAIIDCKGADNWKVFGIVDRDYEEFSLYSNSKGLFVTDTHDIETLIISSDPEIWDRFEDCEIKKEEIRNALYMAYQIAVLRDSIKEYSSLTIRFLKAGNGEVNYSSIIDDGRVSLDSLLTYLNDANKERFPDQVISKKEIEKIKQNILKDKEFKKIIDKDGFLKTTVESFDINKIENFWLKVDGHDILALMKYYNGKVEQKYQDNNGFSINRSFEMDLIKKYDNIKFKSTTLFGDLLKDNLVIDY